MQPASGRPGGGRHQGGAAGRGRFRAGVRQLRAWAGELLRVAQSGEAERHARSEACGRGQGAGAVAGWRRCAAAEFGAGRGGSVGVGACRSGASVPEAGGVRHLGIRRERTVRAEEGLRPADPGRVRADQRDGHRGSAVPGRHLGGGYCDWHVCVVGHPGRVGAAGADRRRRQRQDRHAGRAGGMDDVSDVPVRIRRSRGRLDRRRPIRCWRHMARIGPRTAR